MARSGARIFGIGLNKTGTRSLASALRMLGYRTLHKGDEATARLVDVSAERGEPLLTRIGDHYDAYLDVESLACRFADLDAQYPASRFILTVSDEEQWLASREKHVRANQERQRRGEYSGRWLVVDRESWRAERSAHHEAVVGYFAERPGDLLVMNIPGGDGWASLAPFLGHPVPKRDFPWQNKNGRGTYAPETRLSRLQRSADYAVGRIRRAWGP